MIVMKKRACKLLEFLVREEKALSVEHLARLYNVSERTIYADIKEINSLLKNLNIPIIKSKKGLIHIDKSIDYEIVKTYLKDMGFYSYKMSPVERRDIIILTLLKKNEFLTMEDIADSLFVSRLTVINDINEIKKLQKSYDLSIISKPNKGVKIQCTEINARSLIVDILRNNFSNIKSQTFFQDKLTSKLAYRYSMNDIFRLMKKLEKSINLNLSDEGFHNLLFYLYITINRISEGFYSSNEDLKIGDRELQIATRIYQEISAEINFPIDKNEIDALAIILKEKNIYPLSSNINDYPEIYVVTANFLFSVLKTLGINLSNAHRHSLFEFLVFHIKKINEQSKKKTKKQNPFREQVIRKYSSVYEAVKRNISRIEEYLGVVLDDDEMAYITMHICAAIERYKSNKRRLNIIIACFGSMATGHMLASQIEKHFNFNVCGILSADRLIESDEFNELDIDFVLSSVPLPKMPWPTLIVNPILTKEDYNQIQSMAFSLYKKNKEQRKSAQVLSINSISKMKDRNKNPNISASGQINRSTILNQGHIHSLDNQELPFLHDIIQPNLIMTQAKVENWQDAIHKGGGLLVRNGYIAEEYIHLMIKNIEDNGPYCVIRKGIAIAHAKSKQEVFFSGISMAVITEGVNFGHEQNDPVFLLFCFCVNDSRDYLRMLKNLIALSKEDDFISKLVSTKDSLLAYEIIKQRELDINYENEIRFAN